MICASGLPCFTRAEAVRERMRLAAGRDEMQRAGVIVFPCRHDLSPDHAPDPGCGQWHVKDFGVIDPPSFVQIAE